MIMMMLALGLLMAAVMPAHLVRAVNRGEGARWNGRVWTERDLPELRSMGALDAPAAGPPVVDAALLDRAQAAEALAEERAREIGALAQATGLIGFLIDANATPLEDLPSAVAGHIDELKRTHAEQVKAFQETLQQRADEAALASTNYVQELADRDRVHAEALAEKDRSEASLLDTLSAVTQERDELKARLEAVQKEIEEASGAAKAPKKGK
jgi:hypothetical protein